MLVFYAVVGNYQVLLTSRDKDTVSLSPDYLIEGFYSVDEVEKERHDYFWCGHLQGFGKD